MINISSNLINISSSQPLKHKEIQNWTDFLLCKLGTKLAPYLRFAYSSSGSVIWKNMY